jgi:hypothetical protein
MAGVGSGCGFASGEATGAHAPSIAAQAIAIMRVCDAFSPWSSFFIVIPKTVMRPTLHRGARMVVRNAEACTDTLTIGRNYVSGTVGVSVGSRVGHVI